MIDECWQSLVAVSRLVLEPVRFWKSPSWVQMDRIWGQLQCYLSMRCAMLGWRLILTPRASRKHESHEIWGRLRAFRSLLRERSSNLTYLYQDAQLPCILTSSHTSSFPQPPCYSPPFYSLPSRSQRLSTWPPPRTSPRRTAAPARPTGKPTPSSSKTASRPSKASTSNTCSRDPTRCMSSSPKAPIPKRGTRGCGLRLSIPSVS